MKINCLGGGPGSMYFAILMKKSYPDAQITIYEQNKNDDTFGFGVVFSDQTMEGFREADEPTYEAITNSFEHWDDIDIYFKGEVLKSTGHGFAGMSRVKMLILMQERCRELGIDMHFEHRIDNPEDLRDCDLLYAADGVNSVARDHWKSEFGPNLDFRPNRFVWLGSDFNFPAFTFHFIESEHGLWRTHCYRYVQDMSTVIIECTDETFANTGLGITDEDATVDYVSNMLRPYIGDSKIIKNRSHWRQFPNITCDTWHFDNVVLAGDAVHTAHFSIGSGTKLAMEDAIALHDALTTEGDVAKGLARYEEVYKPEVESLQRSANVSQRWFEEAERYYDTLDPIQFGFSLLTRSLRISHGNLRLRDEEYVSSVDEWFAGQAANQSGVNLPTDPPPPPMFTPFKLRDMVLENRIVVSPMCQYSAEKGVPDDWHLVHLGSRAMGGAGLVIAEMTDVSEEGRISPGCTGIYSDEHVTAWKRVTDFVHQHTKAKIGLQLGHAGRKGSTTLLWDGFDEPLPEGNWPIMAASPLPYKPQSQVPKEMDRADMDQTLADYAAATERAEAAGFDMLEVHMAHGYLLNTFISPLTNVRTDEYGGSLENRMRFPLEVFQAVRDKWPEGKPISVRISAHDWKDGGVTPPDAVKIAEMLYDAGADIVDVSSGQVVSDEEPQYGRLFQTPFSERIRLELDKPTMAVGAISSFEDANSILAGGRADLCVIARAHLFDPYWTRHAAYELDWVGYGKVEWPKQYDTLNRDYVWRFDTTEKG
jgi:anthraniloyl-CoA monooxygenase